MAALFLRVDVLPVGVMLPAQALLLFIPNMALFNVVAVVAPVISNTVGTTALPVA